LGLIYPASFFESIVGCGTVFLITPGGELTSAPSFVLKSGCLHGGEPCAGLIQATDGNLYGTTDVYGAKGGGTIFRMTLSGNLTTPHSFGGPTQGGNTSAGLVEDTRGTFYGTTFYGRHRRQRHCLRLVGKTQPICGNGAHCGHGWQRVLKLGNNLSGATSVTLNGTPATFAVGTGSVIKTTVPAGTGMVHVATPSGTLSSSVTLPRGALRPEPGKEYNLKPLWSAP